MILPWERYLQLIKKQKEISSDTNPVSSSQSDRELSPVPEELLETEPCEETQISTTSAELPPCEKDIALPSTEPIPSTDCNITPNTITPPFQTEIKLSKKKRKTSLAIIKKKCMSKQKWIHIKPF